MAPMQFTLNSQNMVEPAQQENPKGVDENTDENRGQHRTPRAAHGSDPQGPVAQRTQIRCPFLVSFPFAKPEPGTPVFKYTLGPSSASPVSVCLTIPPNNTASSAILLVASVEHRSCRPTAESTRVRSIVVSSSPGHACILGRC